MPQSKPDSPIPPPRVFVIGLDGATFQLIEPMIKDGRLPVLQKLIENGTNGVLNSTIPPVTIPAWVTMLTGKNPGKLGLFDLLKRIGYRSEPNAFCYENQDPVWMIMNRYGIKTGLLNIPGSYPPQEVDGFMVTGMLTPSKLSDYSYPNDLSSQLDKAVNNYELDVQYWQYFDEELFLRDIRKVTEKRVKAMKYLYDKYPCDFYMMVFTCSDRIHHMLWAKQDVIMDYWEMLDKKIGEVISLFPESTNIILVSDHGFGELKKTFFVNKWLRSKKYLRVKGVHSDNLLGRIGKTVEWSYLTLGKLFSKIPGITWLMSGINEIIGQDKLGKLTYEYLSTAKLESRVAWKRTQAFSCIHSPHFGQIYINQRQKMSKGTVKQKDVKLYRERIIEDLKTLVDPKTGDPIKVDVYLPEELYSGEHIDEAPDVIFMLDDGKIEVDATLEDGEIFDEGSPLTGWTGTHTRDGILIAYGPQIQRSKKIDNLDIIDIAPTILHAFGIPIPDDFDGKPINEIFIDGAIIKKKEEITKESIMEQDTALSSEEKALIEERLRKLGYIT